MNQPDRTCATCGRLESLHYASGPGALALGHLFVMRPGDEWCDDCDDWACNGDGSCPDHEDDYREREAELEAEAGGPMGLAHDRGSCDGPGCCRWCDGRTG